MAVFLQETFEITDGLEKLIKTKEDKFTNSEIKTAIRLHVRSFFQAGRECLDVSLPGLGIDIRIKRTSKSTATVGLTKPL